MKLSQALPPIPAILKQVLIFIFLQLFALYFPSYAVSDIVFSFNTFSHLRNLKKTCSPWSHYTTRSNKIPQEQQHVSSAQ